MSLYKLKTGFAVSIQAVLTMSCAYLFVKNALPVFVYVHMVVQRVIVQSIINLTMS